MWCEEEIKVASGCAGRFEQALIQIPAGWLVAGLGYRVKLEDLSQVSIGHEISTVIQNGVPSAQEKSSSDHAWGYMIDANCCFWVLKL
ncbi:hypothetical protein OSB04_003727 [Centaurea solstitialis]|uniref:Uncharacterized protein n=1 Tax=Centaurea solstitialis TaxID=347529 RepID=A0AA38U5V8_9ASTR|nr:hypothetical protein OSB04_003727 [Centaurea solstitialis]